MNDYFITGTYLAEELDKEMQRLASKAGELFLYEDVARKPVKEVARKWADALLRNEAFKKADIVIADLSALLYSADINNAEEASIDPLINAFQVLSSDTKVYLICTFIPEFYVIGDEFVMIYHKQPYFEERVAHLNGLERAFISRTAAVQLNTTKFYFYRKEKGFPLKEGLYEHECYRDIAAKIERYAPKGGKVPDRPEFNISLDRYIKYAYKVDLFDMPFLFLDLSDLVEMFILSSYPDYVKRNADEIRSMHDLKLPSPWRTLMMPIEKAGKAGKYKIRPFRMCFFLIHRNKIILPYKKAYLGSIKKKIKQANISGPLAAEFIAFTATALGIYNDKDADYRSLFKNSIVCRPMLEMIRNYARGNLNVTAKQVSAHNAGYYFAHMAGDAYCAAEYVSEGTVVDPVLVDDLGSCVTRAALLDIYSHKTTLALNEMWLQIPQYILSCKPAEPISVASNIKVPKWAKNNIELQFLGKMEESIRNSDAKWLLMDFFGLITPQTYQYKGLIFTDLSMQYAAQIGAKECSPMDDPSILGTWDEILEKMNPILDLCLEKYGNKIIIAETICMEITLGDDGKYYRYQDAKRMARKNEFLKKAYEYAKEYLGCYTVEIGRNYTSDDRGYRGRYYTHYELDYYKELYDIIENIIQNEPEQKEYRRYKPLPDMTNEKLPKDYPRFPVKTTQKL